MCKNIDVLAGVVDSFLRNKSAYAESVPRNHLKSKNLEGRKFKRQKTFNHPGRESRIVNI